MWRDSNCMENLGWETLKRGDPLKNLGLNGRIIN
jgi:hypothetical protein